MANLSKIKRERMLEFLETLKTQHTDDESIRAFNEIENNLREKKYGLVWEEHTEHVDEMLEKNIPVFCEDADRKILSDASLPYNFILEGDNLQSLNLLEKTHKGKIDVIYIDPPYNTGNEDFIYNDRIIGKEDVYRHSMWLSFMQKRICIAKKLLSKSGIIFISIDEHEISQLLMLCQEIFGDENVDYIIWQKTDSKVDRNTNAKVINRFKNIHEAIIVCYNDKKSTVFAKMMRLPEWKHEQKNPDNDPRGPWSSGIISFKEGHKNEDTTSENYYTVITPSGKKYTRHWFVSKEEFKTLRSDNRISFPKNGDGVPRIKTYQYEEKEYYMETILRGVGTSSTAKDELQEILGNRNIFDTPKPTKLIKEIIRVASSCQSTILDFFAGSGTTGQAVLELNNEDNGRRKFILCTDNYIKDCIRINYFVMKGIIEKKPRKSTKAEMLWLEKWHAFIKSNYYRKEMVSEDYQSMGICRAVTYPRNKTVITGFRNDGSKYSDGLAANLKYFKCDWTPRKPKDYLLSNALCLHIKEMIELQNAIEIDNVKNVLILNKDDFKNTILNSYVYDQIEKIWVNQNMILNSEELELLNAKGYKYIPKEFFGQELREVAE